MAVLAIIAGLVIWVGVATLLNFGLRFSIPGYVQAEPMMNFTLTMKIARLLLSAISCLAAGALIRRIAPFSSWAPWVAGGIVLAIFLPAHINIWPVFPLWYHLTFLLTLIPLFVLGAKLARHPHSAGTKIAPAI